MRGFEPEQIYQQLQTINQDRLKPFIATLIKCKTKSKAFGDLLRELSPPLVSVEEDLEEDAVDEEEPISKKPEKKKKSVTYEDQQISEGIFSFWMASRFFDPNALDKFLQEQDLEELARYAVWTRFLYYSFYE